MFSRLFFSFINDMIKYTLYFAEGEDNALLKGDEKYRDYVRILEEELVPAMGCTEPIAIAYAGAVARKILGCLPDMLEIRVSGNIIKNVKSVIVPNTGGMRGIAAALCAGVTAGDAEALLEVIAGVTPDQKEEIRAYMDQTELKITPASSGHVFEIDLTASGVCGQVRVHIVDSHTNIVLIEKNGEVVFRKDGCSGKEERKTDHSVLNIEDIVDFADTVDVEDVKEVLERQIRYNTAISEEGLRGDYGANIGKVLLRSYGDNIKIRARARAAAGSDARMNGCELPVVINSGSGNQGITASIPVIEFARELRVSHEKMLRALVLSNLVTIHLKTGIGTLSAYCGAVSAGCGSGAGIAYLHGGNYKVIAHTIVNSLAIVSGIICDGAKASCAAKISSAVDAGILGYEMYIQGQQFYGGDGIVTRGVENTIRNVSQLAKDGMCETDKEIIRIMVGKGDEVKAL